MSEQLYKKINGEFVPFGPYDYQEFREKYWSPGLWLVTNRPDCISRALLHKLCDIPDKPEHYASLMMLQDELADTLVKLRQNVVYSSSPSLSIGELSNKILKWLANKQGVKMVKFADPLDYDPMDRRIEPTL